MLDINLWGPINWPFPRNTTREGGRHRESGLPIAAQPFAGAGQRERQVRHGGEQHQRRRLDHVGLQEQVDGQMPAGRVARHDRPLGRKPVVTDEPVPAGSDIVCGGGEPMPRCKPIVDAEHRQTGQPGEPRDKPAMGARRAQGVAAAVDEIDCGIGMMVRHSGAVNPFPDDASAVGGPGVDWNDASACKRRPERVHDAGNDLAGQPQRPCLLGWKHAADLSKGQAADRCGAAGT